MPTTSITDLVIDLSRIRLLSRLGVATNQNLPTSISLDHEHGPTFPLRRGKH
jgi:hypothetical protein